MGGASFGFRGDGSHDLCGFRGKIKISLMSAKKEDVLRQLNSKLGTSTTPKQELTVTGYGVPLISSHRKGYGTGKTSDCILQYVNETFLYVS